MKKIFAIALAIIMTLSVVLGCSNSKKETPPAASQTKITETAKSADNSNTAKDHKEKKKDKQQTVQQKSDSRARCPDCQKNQKSVQNLVPFSHSLFYIVNR